MLVGIQDEILRLNAKGLLAPLLADKTTKRNILWATDAYHTRGFPYERAQEILPMLITGTNADVIKTRAYIKSKFLRAMLSILKVTQNGNRGVWKMIPLQNFTSSSDIDWSQSIAEIDRQLYAKYGLSAEEIAFIESHVKEMT